MDRRITLVIVGVMLFVIIFLVGCVAPSPLTATPPPPPCALATANTWNCPQRTGVLAEVRRHVTIVAPPQGGRDLVVTAGPLPTEQIPPPPAVKNIKPISMVIELEVTYKDNGARLFDFTPPLTITIEYTAEDCKATNKCSRDSKPPLYIVTAYPVENVWLWAKLDTTVVCGQTCETGMLTAAFGTLHPKDPVEEGCC